MTNVAVFVAVLMLVLSCDTHEEEPFRVPDVSNLSTNAGITSKGRNFYYDVSKKQLFPLKDGFDLNISPDGSLLAYTEYYPSENKNAAGANRRVAILDLATGAKNILDFPSEQILWTGVE